MEEQKNACNARISAGVHIYICKMYLLGKNGKNEENLTKRERSCYNSFTAKIAISFFIHKLELELTL